MTIRNLREGRSRRSEMHVEISRHIEADPAALALMLGGPGAALFWPAEAEVRHPARHRWILEQPGEPLPAQIGLETKTPARFGDRYRLRFHADTNAGLSANGTAILAEEPGKGAPTTRISVRAEASGPGAHLLPAYLAAYLRNLAEAAELRAGAP